jgi:hypothetical protein
MSKFGFSDDKLLLANSSLIISHIRLYGTTGLWASKPGFGMQGSASSGMLAFCGEGVEAPAWPPGMVVNDYTTGYFGALAVQAAVLRRMKEVGAYIISPSLCGSTMAILKYFKTSQSQVLASSTATALPPDEWELQTGKGVLKMLKSLLVLDQTPISYGTTVLDAMGFSAPVFPGSEETFNFRAVEAARKEEITKSMQHAATTRADNLRKIAGRSDVRSVL